MLKGKSPVASSVKDSRGWGNRSGKYSTSAGYHLLANIANHENFALWKRIWVVKSLPKIIFFTWTVLHDKILTGANLQKKGWEGPTRCPFCLSQEENTEHVLISCDYAQSVWKASLPEQADLPLGNP